MITAVCKKGLNPFPNKPWFLRVYSTRLLKHSQLSRTCIIGSLAYQQIDEKLDVNRQSSGVSGVWRTLTVCNR